MQFYFQLQFKMLNRQLKEFGLPPWAGYLLGTIAFLGISVMLFDKVAFAPYIYAALGLSYISRLSDSARNDFLKSCYSDKDYRLIRGLENTIVALPFLIFLLIKQEYLVSFGLLLISVVLALLNFGNKLNYTIPTPFYKHPFEFIVGFRKTFYLFILAGFLTFMAINVDNFNLGIFSLLLVFLTSLSFYTTPEQSYFVWIYALEPKAFLLEKIKSAILMSTIISLPIAICLMFFYPENLWIILAFQCLGYLYLVMVVLAKYTAFPGQMNVPQGILFALSIWFPPMLLAVIPIFYSKATKKLKAYLE